MNLIKSSVRDYIYDLTWVFMILGSAIGAGVLFLPIKLGENGVISIFIMWVVMILINTRTHSLLSLLCLDENSKADDKTWFLRLFKYPMSYILMFIYILPVFFTMVFLSLSLINAAEFLLQNRFDIFLDRNFIAISVVLMLVGLSIPKLSFIKYINNILVVILCSSLILFSLYLVFFVLNIKGNEMLSMTNYKDTSKTIIESFPIAIYSFSYLPLIFVFVKDLKSRYIDYDLVEYKIKNITLVSNIILISIIMFFALVSVLAVNYDDLYKIKKANVSIVSYLAERHDNILISWIVPIVTSTAIITSFFSYYIGSVKGVFELFNFNQENKIFKVVINLTFILLLIGFAIYNPSILSFISKISGPLIIFISIVLPLYTLYSRKDFMSYRSLMFDIFMILVLGFVFLNFI